MGLPSFISNISGQGEVNSPKINKVGGDYLSLLGFYDQGAGKLFNSASSLSKKYGDLTASESARLAPGAMDLIRGSDPARAALLQKILAAAGQDDLNYGGGLPPGLLRLTQQLSRSGQAARGMGYGPSDLYGETGDAARLSADLTDRNRLFATNAANTSYQLEGDPFLRLLSGQVSSGLDALLKPANSLSLLQMPYEGRLKAKMATAQNNTGLANAQSAAEASVIGSLI